MKLEILYKGKVIGTLSAGQTAIVPKGKKFASDIVVRAVADMISFTIADVPYQAEYGMTWEQWVASEYNTDGYKIVGGQIKLNDTDLKSVVYPSTMGVIITDKIIADYNYLYHSHNAGDND